MTGGLEYIKKLNKKIILLGGAGEHGIWAEVLLRSKGISIYGYADNSRKLQGKYVRGKKIVSPYQIFEENQYYIIISVANPHINCVRFQLMTHGIGEYGIFLSESFHDFEDENVKLQGQLMETINEICFENETLEDALPYIGLSVG